MEAQAELYKDVDAEALQADADACMLHFGTDFEKDIVTRAQGTSIYTAAGHGMLDWTSGQMVCWSFILSLYILRFCVLRGRASVASWRHVQFLGRAVWLLLLALALEVQIQSLPRQDS